VTEYTATLIDHVYTNALDMFESNMYVNGILFCDISDHFPVFHLCKSYTITKGERFIIYRQNTCERNLMRFKQELDKTNWNDVYAEMDVNKGYDSFSNKFNKIYRRCIPSQKHTVKEFTKPWMTECILNSVKRKNKLYHMFIKNPTSATRERYKAYRNKLNHVIRISQRKYTQDMLNKYHCDMKKSWKLIDSIIDSRDRYKKLLEKFKYDEESISDPIKIANYFNKYFTNVGPNVARKIGQCDVDPLQYVHHNVSSPIFLNPVSEDEMTKILGALKDSSSGIDEYQPKVVKYVKSGIIKPLCHIVNKSLEHGVFPRSLKNAIVTPIYKGGEKNKVENYRPVSVLSVFSKVYEKVMYNRLFSYLDINNILYNHQYGFRSGFSTDQALIHVIDNIIAALDRREHLVGVFMDLAKAFDSISHSILLRKLASYGIQGQAIKWITC